MDEKIFAQQAKMAALGKLSAGLAHELNNPAAAARRAARSLAESLPRLERETLQLSSLALNEAQLEKLVAFQRDAVASVAQVQPLSPLERGDREEEIGSWLEEKGFSNGWDLASTFVNAGLTLDELQELSHQLPDSHLQALFAWLGNTLYTTGLLNEIEQSTGRISELVSAIKSYAYMDQAARQEVDLHKGLENTLTMLNHKLKNIHVVREYDPGLPRITGRGSQLNQVWTNLIDNAIDAMQGEGTLRIITRGEKDFAVVEVVDNGPGIPTEIQPRLFEPFFTTKEEGVGTGLGLDISYQIIKQHNGTFDVRSQPGDTRFIVRLPLGQPSSEEPQE